MKRFVQKYFLTGFLRISLAIAVAVIVVLPAIIAFADTTETAGGSGGASYLLACGSGKALVGIRGSSGLLVHSVQGVCAQINYDGSWQGNTTRTGTAGGQVLGNSYNLTCNPGYAVTGIRGKAGSYVEQLQVRCGPLGRDGRFASTGSFLSGSAAGGTGGDSFGPLDCPNSKPARVIHGRASSSSVDAIALGCEYVNTLMPLTVGLRNYSPRVGEPVSALVSMNLKPAATATVSVTSSNTSVATASSASIGTSTTYGSGTVTGLTPGCTNIIFSYAGWSQTQPFVVNSAASPKLSLTTPHGIGEGLLGQATVAIPAIPIAPGNVTVRLASYNDSGEVTMPDSVIIPQGQTSASFEVRAYLRAGVGSGCLRIKATGNGGVVTHFIRVLPSIHN